MREADKLTSCTECHKIWEPKPPGTLWTTPGMLRDFFTFTVVLLCFCEDPVTDYVYGKFVAHNLKISLVAMFVNPGL